MKCGNCGNENAWHMMTRWDGEKQIDQCNACGLEGGGDGIPDVYWPGGPHYNPNLCDKMGNPILLTSRKHKAEVMKKLHAQEAGDSYRGSRRST